MGKFEIYHLEASDIVSFRIHLQPNPTKSKKKGGISFLTMQWRVCRTKREHFLKGSHFVIFRFGCYEAQEIWYQNSEFKMGYLLWVTIGLNMSFSPGFQCRRNFVFIWLKQIRCCHFPLIFLFLEPTKHISLFWGNCNLRGHADRGFLNLNCIWIFFWVSPPWKIRPLQGVGVPDCAYQVGCS